MAAEGLLVRRDGQNTTPVATAAVLVAAAVIAVHLVGVRLFSHEAWPGASPEVSLPMWAAALSGGCLLLSVVAAWVSRTARPGVAFGLAAAAVGAALPAWASWTGAPPTLRSAVLAAPALAAAGLAQTVPRWSAGASRLGLLAWMFAAAAVLVHVLGYDPVADLYCSRVCRSAVGPWLEGTAPQAVVAGEGLLVLGAVTAGLMGVVVGRSVPTMVRGAVGVSLVIVAVAALAELVWRDTEVWARTTSLWLPWALGPTASAACIFAVRAAKIRRAIDSLLGDLESGQAGGVQFAVAGEDRWVDGAGRDVPMDTSAVVVLHDDHGPAVRLANTSAGQAAAVLSPSRTLALSNARLTALAAARLADVRAAQRRTVHRADSERHRIERDLHDGAQQALVSAVFHLSAVATRKGSPEIVEAQAHVAAALAGLRDLVHGPVPEVLLYEGIRAALEDIAAEAPSQVIAAVHGEEEPPTEVAVAAYLCVVALVGRASPEPCAVDVDITEPGTRVVVRSRGDLANPVDQDLLDRVGALGGTVTWTRDGGEWSVEVWLPCGS
jgi:signal transduction histidine kinase